MWLTPLLPWWCVWRQNLCGCDRVDVTTTQSACMCDWVSVWYQHVSLVWIRVCVCVCGRTCQASGWGDSRVACWLLTRMDGWMWTSLSRSFHSDWADSSVWVAFVILLVWCALQPLPLMDHSEPPSCLWVCLCAPCGHLQKCYPRCVCGCMRASAAHKCAFVNMSGHAASSTIVFFIETSGVF